MDCLNELALNEFLTETDLLPDIVERFESETDPITVFALSNEAFAGLDDITRALLLVKFPERQQFLHILEKEVFQRIDCSMAS